MNWIYENEGGRVGNGSKDEIDKKNWYRFWKGAYSCIVHQHIEHVAISIFFVNGKLNLLVQQNPNNERHLVKS